ncbi:MAG: T9SS type A sorting domain-containing protein [Bacteroidales bacterium]|jgi:hypothetical protein|nr:T9SS type A sorting domain-containing protein [Bacteroidales bacterium]
MYPLKYFIPFFLFLYSIPVHTCGQSSVNTGGNNITHSTGKISYSIGEIFYQTDNNISQGVQQGYKIEVITVRHEKINDFLIYACPNPTKNIITLSLPNSGIKDYSCKIYDNSGREIIRKDIISGETSVDLSRFTQGIYFLRVYRLGREIKVFKIIKTRE